MPNSFVWYELVTSDAPAAERFYGEVVGWTATPSLGASGPYALMGAGGAPIAGIMPIPPEMGSGARPGWIGYVGVDDVEAAAGRVTAAGGAIHRAPGDIPGVGRFAAVADAQGAPFVLFAPNEAMPPSSPMTPGHVGWHELSAVHGPSAFDWYAGLFGWTKDMAMPMGDLGVYQLFAAGSDAIGGIMTRMDATRPPAWLFYFTVADIDEAAGRVKAAGGQVRQDPMEVPGGAWIVNGLDPQGAEFALVGPRAIGEAA